MHKNTMNNPIKFGTDGWRAVIAKDFTFDNLSRISLATAKWIKSQAAELGKSPSVMIGFDCRFNGKLFAMHTANLLAQEGIKVFISPDFTSTPMVSLATSQRQTIAGIVITASHNPPEYSGFKIKGHFGGPAFPSMISQIEDYISDEVPEYKDLFEILLKEKKIEYYDQEALYINHLRQTFQIDKIKASKLNLAYDAMYGAGQNVMRKLLPQTLEHRCTYNPSFMGQAPEPIERNLIEFKKLIREKNIHWGLATDGDADRVGLFDENAFFVDSHHLILLLIIYLTEYKKLSGKVVYTFSCTQKIEQLCQKINLPYEVTKIGFKYIGEIMACENVLIGGEESGGIAVTGHLPERDGIYIGMMILDYMAESGKKLTELITDLYKKVGPFSVQRSDLHIHDADKSRIWDMLKTDSIQQIGGINVKSIQKLDGFKLLLDNNTWVMIRPSGTEPVLRIYAEAETANKANQIIDATRNIIKA